ncbi:hypothetical protein HPB52_011171 [Rhipicephalus sanguineus]|uniref:CCHC-type domain-containing protein n=1 Tax=Rhipicephalus sanguineus TaxID=34632 RepID=A0A9D4Q0F0_RHISA|nr:hypothetical protein HPB52_011171 [Rhipicephalus sanguineus]
MKFIRVLVEVREEGGIGQANPSTNQRQQPREFRTPELSQLHLYQRKAMAQQIVKASLLCLIIVLAFTLVAALVFRAPEQSTDNLHRRSGLQNAFIQPPTMVSSWDDHRYTVPRGRFGDVREAPVCFYCGFRGHVARFCAQRRRAPQRHYEGPPPSPRQNSWRGDDDEDDITLDLSNEIDIPQRTVALPPSTLLKPPSPADTSTEFCTQIACVDVGPIGDLEIFRCSVLRVLVGHKKGPPPPLWAAQMGEFPFAKGRREE